MKKLLGGIALLLAPILLYTAFFLYLEPNNYYGLRAETPSGAIFGALHTQAAHPAEVLMVGDSRTAHLPMAVAEEALGRRVANLSFGGASVAEELALVEWMLQEYPDIDTVIFGLSFYTLNAGYGQNRIESIQKALRNPFEYLTNLSYHLEVWNMVPDWLAGRPLYGGASETQDPATYTYTAYTTPAGETVTLRETVAAYFEVLAPILAGWQLDEEDLEGLLLLIDECTEAGIRFVVVLPPMHPALRQYLVDGYGITPVMQDVVALLSESGAEMYDYEFTHPPAWADDMFYDGLHLDYARGLPAWTRTFFEELS